MSDELNNKIEELKKKINELRNEIKNLDETGYATMEEKTVPNYEYNSDTGTRTPFGEKKVIVEMSADRIESNKRHWENERSSLERELNDALVELAELEANKPENIEKRKQEEIIRNEEEQRRKLDDKRLIHEKGYEDLDKLVMFLRWADMAKLATHLSELRFAEKNKKSNYVISEIDLRIKEREFKTKTQTTKKEYREIKRDVIRLTKKATDMAKTYKQLHNLYLNAGKIIRDMEKKGILSKQGIELEKAVNEYFTLPVGEYYIDGEFQVVANLGYQYLEFYRSPNSKYREDVKKRKV